AAIGIMLLAGLISTVQNNTAVTALLLPATVAIARSTRLPALPLLALSYGATFGGMATPVGTAPNFIGYSAISKFSSSFSFVYWMRVGVPVWLGATVIAWGVITLLARFAGRWPVRIGSWFQSGGLDDVGPALEPHMNAVEEPAEKCADGRLAAWTMFALAASIWLTVGICKSALGDGHPTVLWLNRYVPDSLVPVAAAAVLFVWRAGPRMRPVLDRHDFQSLDWDTLFLIAGGLCLGKTLEQSGAAAALAASVAALKVSPLLVMLALGGVTVLLSELTSNTATAQLMVPLAASIAPAVGLSPMKTIWLVALSASMGFALPVSTPPNAIVYGTRLVPLRLMIVAGLAIDVLGLAWVVACIHWLG
ncbi:MAG: anion permease, partial [Planctomycetes bacterium]|nr:anion permease [Planctomycetota bacterium]